MYCSELLRLLNRVSVVVEMLVFLMRLLCSIRLIWIVMMDWRLVCVVFVLLVSVVVVKLVVDGVV